MVPRGRDEELLASIPGKCCFNFNLQKDHLLPPRLFQNLDGENKVCALVDFKVLTVRGPVPGSFSIFPFAGAILIVVVNQNGLVRTKELNISCRSELDVRKVKHRRAAEWAQHNCPALWNQARKSKISFEVMIDIFTDVLKKIPEGAKFAQNPSLKSQILSKMGVNGLLAFSHDLGGFHPRSIGEIKEGTRTTVMILHVPTGAISLTSARFPHHLLPPDARGSPSCVLFHPLFRTFLKLDVFFPLPRD